ncbi:MAG TPA: hypothetical protein VMB50_14115 [Myxococcales bacterium]|nr:hypothetical protein [Myxococcales bacterium]
MDETKKSFAPSPDPFAKAMAQIERVRDAVVRSSQIGKIKLDATFLRRERDRLVKQLGEEALNLMLVDRLAVPQELQQLLAEIRVVEGRIEADGRQMDEILHEGLEGAK